MRRELTMLMTAAILLSLAAVAGQASDKGPEGFWYGLLKVGPVKLRLGVVIAKGPDGVLRGVLDSLDQNAKNIPMDAVTVTDKGVAFTIKPLAIQYEGTLSAGGRSIKGTLTQAGAALPLTLERTERRVENLRPQHPRKPYPYVEEEVSYRSGSITLAGTFTRPIGDGPFPAVLLITGSGAQDRDETILGHKPFLVLADHLTRMGLAVLRVDDRGVGGSTGLLTDAGIEDLAEDVLAGVAYLKRRKDVEPERIGLIGHSEGGMVAPLVASRSRDVAFLVLLAAPGVAGEEVLQQQLELVLKGEREMPEEELARARERQRRTFAIIKESADGEATRRKLLQLLEEEAARLPEEQKKGYERIRAQVAAHLQAAATPWFRSFVRYDTRLALAKVACPVLALNGEKDVQVAPKENLSAIGKALRAGGNKDFTLKELPSLNHLFQHSSTGAVDEYGVIEETFAPQALQTISDWLLARTAR